jgi:hypothetical protein
MRARVCAAAPPPRALVAGVAIGGQAGGSFRTGCCRRRPSRTVSASHCLVVICVCVCVCGSGNLSRPIPIVCVPARSLAVAPISPLEICQLTV